MSDSNPILVTGAAGWLGVNFVHALANGIKERPEVHQPFKDSEIRCLCLPGQEVSSLQKISKRVRIYYGDLRDPNSLSEFTRGAQGGRAFHLAGIIHPKRVREFYQINVEGTQNFLEACASANVQRAVIMSSNSPMGCNPDSDHLFDESSPYNPYMHYGRSKMKMEQMVQSLSRDKSLETVIVRAPWFYGPHQPARQTLFFSMIRNGKFPIVGSGQNRRSMSYVDNLSQGLMLAATHTGASEKTYWIADEHPYTMIAIVRTIEKLLSQDFQLSVKPNRIRLPKFVGDVAQVVDLGLQSVGLYHQKIHVLSEMNKNIACSVEIAKAELDYRPTVDLEEGMRRSIRWCLENGMQI